MAFIDYGAMLRIDGRFVNKNTSLFMKVSDTGYEPPEYVEYEGAKFNIRGNYFVYAGDEEFLICFYKNIYIIISNGEVLKASYGDNISRISYIFPQCEVTIKHLDNNKYIWKEAVTLDEFDKNHIKVTKCKQYIRIIHRQCKRANRLKRNKGSWVYDKSPRYIATWEYKGRKYECIFGYGIDPQRDVWDDIKYNRYYFSDIERNIIDSWFEGE